MGIETIVMGGAALLGAASSNRASQRQQEGYDAATAEQSRQYDQTREDFAPYRHIGTQALNALGSIYGYSPYESAQQNQPAYSGGSGISGMIGNLLNRQRDGTVRPGAEPRFEAGPQSTPTSPDYSAFFASPDYNFRRTEGNRNIENSFAARGGAASGNALRALTEYNSNLAAGEFGNYFNRQASLAGIGQSATNSTATAGANAANNIAQNYIGAGDARASGIRGVGDAITSGIGNYLYYRGRNAQPWDYNTPPYVPGF